MKEPLSGAKMDILKSLLHRVNLKSYWFIGVVSTWSVFWVLANIMMHSFIVEHDFLKLSKKSVKHQKSCLENFLRVFNRNRIPIILFDVDILQDLFQHKSKSWHDTHHECKTLCKIHPHDKNILSFAIQGSHFYEKEDTILESLKQLGFIVHLTVVSDPRIVTKGVTSMIPSHLWVAKNDHIIHVSFLHERVGKFLWIGPISHEQWKDTIGHLEPTLTNGWHNLADLGVNIPRYEQAFDISHNLLGLPLEVDGTEVLIPYHIKGFLTEYKHAKFVECNWTRAAEFRQKYPTVLSSNDKMFMANAKKLILRAKHVLDGLNVPFWLSSGTCLGWFRQCDIIPYAGDVDFGILIKDYQPRITEEMEQNGLMLTHKFGRVNDSFELSFMGE